MKNSGNIFIVSLMVIFIISCDKKDYSVNQEEHFEIKALASNGFLQVDFVKFQDGRLLFEDRESFDLFISTMQEHQHELDNFESHFLGFISARMAYDKFCEDYHQGVIQDFEKSKDYVILLESEGEQYFEQVVYPNLLSILFNKDGLIQIGDSVFKFMYDKIISTNISNLDYIKNFEDDDELSHLFIITKNQHTVLNEFTITSCENPCREDYDAGYRRIRGRLGEIRTGIYNELYISTTSLRRPCTGFLCPWYQRAVYRLEYEATGVIAHTPIIHQQFNVTNGGYNTARISQTLASSGGATPFIPEYVYANGLHRLKQTSSSNWVECSSCR